MFDLDSLPGKLLTLEQGNAKVRKGAGKGFMSAIMHLAPANLSGRNTCPHATDGCRAACLNTAGHGGMGLDADGLNTVQAARIRRTRWFQRDRDAFMAQLVKEIAAHERSALRHKLKPVVRLNGTSDLPWERFAVVRDGKSYPHMFAAFPGIIFYDYTKWPIRLRPLVSGIPNYSLTFSLAEDNDVKAGQALKAGVNVAAVFNARAAVAGRWEGGKLPDTYVIDGSSYPVIDGDVTDLRFIDPSGPVIVGLRAKGRGKRDRTGFVRAV